MYFEKVKKKLEKKLKKYIKKPQPIRTVEK